MVANGSEKAFCVLKFHEFRSVTIVQRQFRNKFGKQPPPDKSIRSWCAQFQRQGACVKGKALVSRLWQKSKCSRSDRYITPRFYYKPVRYVTKTWSVVLLNKKIHILLSQVYCVWQVVNTPTIISNNRVFVYHTIIQASTQEFFWYGFTTDDTVTIGYFFNSNE